MTPVNGLVMDVDIELAVKTVLLLLLGGCECARLVGGGLWNYALELSVLHRLGVSVETLQDAVTRGYVVCRSETAAVQGFPDFRVVPRTRAALTDVGAARAWEVALAQRRKSDGRSNGANGEGHSRQKPRWDRHARNLYYGETLILHFRRDAPNQMRILDTFQELRWTAHIDDPLPPSRGVDRRERLYETVRSLNGGQAPLRLRFRMEANGQGVRWSVVEA